MQKIKTKKIIYVLGTKVQFIKCKQILLNLIKENVEILILDTGQHKELTIKELNESGLVYEYLELSENKKNIATIFGMISWFVKILFSLKLKNKLSGISYSMVHGDTVSTLIGLLFSKRNKIKTIHLESGYKSNNIFQPFPEEIIRNIVSRFSDVLVVDGESQYKNISKYINKKEIIKISRNTIYDSVAEYLKTEQENFKNTLTITVHRTENIYNKKRLESLIDLLYEIKNKYNFEIIQWFCHDVTRNILSKNNLINEIEANGIILKNLIPHNEFIKEIVRSKLIITDGGSIAEECSILGLNTVIWRDVVENESYLNQNVILSNYEYEKIYSYIENLPNRKS
ncbi:MAG: hypothetical protein CL470_08980, partial [Acidimicrobiaceae bacterium]|nr:hypothetical protein [Acidimicrobiaceae bacterium]